MSFTDQFSDAIAEIEDDDLGVKTTMRWAAADFPCIASGQSKTGTLEPFGFNIGGNLTVIVRANAFNPSSGYPQRGELITVNGVNFRIETIGTAPGNAFLRLTCSSATKGV